MGLIIETLIGRKMKWVIFFKNNSTKVFEFTFIIYIIEIPFYLTFFIFKSYSISKNGKENLFHSHSSLPS